MSSSSGTESSWNFILACLGKRMSLMKRNFSFQVKAFENLFKVMWMGRSRRTTFDLCSFASLTALSISEPGLMPTILPSFSWAMLPINAKR